MQQATGELVQVYLEDGLIGGRLLCPQRLIPAPGQYLLASDPASDGPLAAPVFNAGPISGGFLVAPPIPPAWHPGLSLTLRGPLGRGFSMPVSARCVALVALAETAARLKPLLANALGQGASIVLISDLDLPDLPPEVEVRPVAALAEVAQWADYLAIDLSRESLSGLLKKLGPGKKDGVKREAQALILTPMPCGGMADCGVCAVAVRRGWKMACKDGPVFDLDELI
jgi:Iron-sulfur cluster binding domain of dihydroorotate dehydrogenase B